MDAANLLKPLLARGALRCIGATTLNEYRKHIEKDAAFERRFQQVFVGEPSVVDTVAILRGLKDTYEAHHGVELMDAALVGAAQLSDRYISHRFLPDKAIDLIDEACANVRVQLDSQPEVIDQLERQILQLQVEKLAMSKEKDEISKKRLKEVERELADLNEKLLPLKAQLEAERASTHETQRLKEKLHQLQAKAEAAERRNDFAIVADLRYGAIPEVEKQIKQSEAAAKVQKESCLVSKLVGPEQIAEVVARWTGIPVTRLNDSERQRVLNLPSALTKRVVGQNAAITAVSEAILRSRSGLSASHKPCGTFLFLGPTGVGKTELAKALAENLFDSERHVVRIDMSEFMEEHSVARLIGAPPGYIGHDEGGQLTESVRRRPYSVILLDEIEKAHRNIWNVFLQVLDEGHLTDGKGVKVDFSNTIIILTSNIGAQYLLANPSSLEAQKQVTDELSRHFRPEFLNRLDDIIFFQPLSEEKLEEIVQIQVATAAARLQEKGMQLQVTPGACNTIIKEAYNPSMGARPLRRYLEKTVMTPISRRLVSGELSSGDIIRVVTPTSAARLRNQRNNSGQSI
eukprot:TRINITY_DN10134_c0_g1_i2.p1 TRINITY_DN10134_c0_g1~~TRINITY_DN10134_c0_g1_i2.p1  ORF type:complete len:574 (+),score=165.73 TRINITY_DN10134_c0_g1_i2:898-2619(+)